MSPAAIRVLGLALALAYAGAVAWLYATQPRSLAEVRGGVAATVGAYAVDRASFDEGLRFFRRDQFAEARSAWSRADPAQRDALTQFYLAYSYLRQGWGRLYHDDAMYRQGLAAVDRAVAAAPGGVLRVDDPGLTLRTTDELRAELERGLQRGLTDLGGLRGWGSRP